MSEADTSVLSDDSEPKKPLPSFDSETTESKDENSQNDSKNENPPSERSGSAEKETVKHLDASKVEYIGDKCYYTDPSSGTKFEWNESSKEWAPVTDLSRNYELKNGVYHYTDQNSGTNYKWNADKNDWDVLAKSADQESDDESEESDDDIGEPKAKKKKSIVRQDMTDGVYGMDGDRRTYTDPKDGTVYVWDEQKNAWFPKVDDDFIAQYQMSYGFTDSAQPSEKKDEPAQDAEVAKPPETKEEPEVLKKKPSEPAWFDVDEKTNTKVYVSNLPLDITEQEFLDLMQKCGLVMKDLDTGKMKIKLYTEAGSQQLKGDGLCTYIKEIEI
ncbi:RRM [Nesidiocoris tenuis]|uniref:RRM n=1 Tax=Nesidiocoris tenuis TaxID=355587 RepID=A0ABN7BBN2_9HEMI|nr:RRM [Nesidiocoris tenuis]